MQCLHRWQKVLDPRLVKGPWKPEEDELINQLVAQHGARKWSVVAAALPGRIGKQCRERWHNHRQTHNAADSVRSISCMSEGTVSESPTVSLFAIALCQ